MLLAMAYTSADIIFPVISRYVVFSSIRSAKKSLKHQFVAFLSLGQQAPTGGISIKILVTITKHRDWLQELSSVIRFSHIFVYEITNSDYKQNCVIDIGMRICGAYSSYYQ